MTEYVLMIVFMSLFLGALICVVLLNGKKENLEQDIRSLNEVISSLENELRCVKITKDSYFKENRNLLSKINELNEKIMKCEKTISDNRISISYWKDLCEQFKEDWCIEKESNKEAVAEIKRLEDFANSLNKVIEGMQGDLDVLLEKLNTEQNNRMFLMNAHNVLLQKLEKAEHDIKKKQRCVLCSCDSSQTQ